LAGGEPDADRNAFADFGPDRPQDLGGESHPVLDPSAVFVGARVQQR
jgi:hypothetical protein